jgi:hypothetical protein
MATFVFFFCQFRTALSHETRRFRTSDRVSGPQSRHLGRSVCCTVPQRHTFFIRACITTYHAAAAVHSCCTPRESHQPIPNERMLRNTWKKVFPSTPQLISPTSSRLHYRNPQHSPCPERTNERTNICRLHIGAKNNNNNSLMSPSINGTLFTRQISYVLQAGVITASQDI